MSTSQWKQIGSKTMPDTTPEKQQAAQSEAKVNVATPGQKETREPAFSSGDDERRNRTDSGSNLASAAAGTPQDSETWESNAGRSRVNAGSSER
jgi:hypothetical protein